jgi:DNA repair protein SbcC/Rad50
VDAIAGEIASAQAQVTHSEELARQSGLRVDKDWLGNEALRLDQQVSSLGQLIEETARLEAAMDAAEKTASMVVAERRLLDMDEDIRATEDERRRLETAKEEFFEKLRRRIDRVQHAAIGEYVQSFGPLASVIQSRLRPVYGFGPMKLTPKGGEVELSVEGSHGSGLRPDLYFSESQLQTTMLSLYLSAALTQEWSPLTAVLMDDPVTHFDDLNSYAFLDLIRSLVSGKCRRQFILSTCEDRLYRLMHRKFAGLNVRFYEFKSIGTDGPVIVQTD